MSRTKPSQPDRIINALRTAGKRGICQTDFNAGSVIDGGDPIPQITRRICDLRKHFLIATEGERNGFAVYVFEGIRSADSDVPVLLASGWAAAYGCHSCAALCARREYACRPYPVLVTPGAAMYECRRQQEVARAA